MSKDDKVKVARGPKVKRLPREMVKSRYLHFRISELEGEALDDVLRQKGNIKEGTLMYAIFAEFMKRENKDITIVI